MTYFSEKEQQCPCCKQIKLANGFLEAMDRLREMAGRPLAVNSMCRCEAHNNSVGGAKGSYHLITHPWGCCAADISTVGWGDAERWRFGKIAMSEGFSVGVAKTFIHVDLRQKYAGQNPVLYSY